MANEQQQRHDDKRKAMQAVRDAVRRGHIDKPSACESCETATPRAQLAGHHHRGHENKLDVAWLCPKCHSAADENMQYGGYHHYRTGRCHCYANQEG